MGTDGSPPHQPVPARVYLGALAATVLLGLLSRMRPVGLPLFDENLGDALYAVAVYLVLALFVRRRAPSAIGAIAFALCAAIELFQLTGIPARHAAFPPVRWLLGTHFAWYDLVCYAVGTAAAASADAAVRRRLSRSGEGQRGGG